MFPYFSYFTCRSQALYGIIQGGTYEDLRDESTAFINEHAFFGTAIGGSLGSTKKDMHDIVAYTRARVRDDRPVHLLGIGGVRDIFHGVRQGIDTFDCVHPSRLARHGGALGEEFRRFLLFFIFEDFYAATDIMPEIDAPPRACCTIIATIFYPLLNFFFCSPSLPPPLLPSFRSSLPPTSRRRPHSSFTLEQ